MRHEPRHVFPTEVTPDRRPMRTNGLPIDLAFLRDFGVSAASLRQAAREAKRVNRSASAVLIASGAISATLYYKSLARHLRLGFADGPIGLMLGADPAAAIRDGQARRREPHAGWLLAPTDAAIILLLKANALGVAMPPLAITTPAHFSALVFQQGGDKIARRASMALLERDADLSAKRVSEAARYWPAVLLPLVAGACAAPPVTTTAMVLLFFAAISFRLLVCANALRPPPAEDASLADARLPIYSVLVPLYDEAGMIPSLIGHLNRLDYPRARLQILILVETDDRATRQALDRECLAPHYEIVVIPDGRPRTKPRALNVGLALSKGEIVTVFDAEDAPDFDQLRLAAAAFARGPSDLACLQARLAVDNAEEALLARLFAIEYAGLFDVYNVGLANSGLPMALGGTSNHFRRAALVRVGGWDAWNVAEDADLGFRLARFGYRVGMVGSTTRERALTNISGWFKQRRRWTKGWIQTILVLAQRPRRTWRDLGPRHTGVVILVATNLVLGPLLWPVLTALVLRDLSVEVVGGSPDILQVAADTLWVWVFAMGFVAPLFCGYAGIRARGLLGCRAALPLIIPYQAMIAAAAWMGAFDLIKTPFHWHKTAHDVTSAKPPPPSRKKAPLEALSHPWTFTKAQPLRALRAAYLASRAALRAASSATTREARASKAAASAAFASSAATRSASRWMSRAASRSARAAASIASSF